jgi:class 3 adenylate cyclase
LFLDEIREEFKRFAPAYAQEEAEAAFEKVMELQGQGVLRPGLYYIVLVDLIGSTKFIAEHGNEAGAQRIEYFVRAAWGCISRVSLRNLAIPIKEIGDAVLLLFQTFPDILAWQSEFERELRAIGEITASPPMEIRTCVHVGDVLLEGVNPIALAVSQLFKIEKNVGSGDIALTDAAYHTAWPTLGRAYHAFEDCGLVDLDGHPTRVMLHRLFREQHPNLAEFVAEGGLDV